MNILRPCFFILALAFTGECAASNGVTVTVSADVQSQLNQLSVKERSRAMRVIAAANKFIPNQIDGVATADTEDGSPADPLEPKFEPVLIENGEERQIGHREVCPLIILSSFKFGKKDAVLTYKSKIVGTYLERMYPAPDGGRTRYGGFENFTFDKTKAGEFYEVKLTVNYKYEVIGVALPDNLFTFAYTVSVEDLTKNVIASDGFPKEDHHIWIRNTQREIEVINEQAAKICK